MKRIAKAIFASVVTFVTTLGTAVVSGESLSQVDVKIWLFVIGATLVAGGGVYGIPNSTTS